MNSIFERNLEALEAKHPRTAERIAEAEVPDDRRSFVNDRNVSVLQYQKEGRWFYLTSAYNPLAEAKQQIRGIDNLAGSKLIFVLGEAGLYHVEAVLQQASEDAVVLLISKNFANLRVTLEARDLTHVLHDQRFCIVADEDEVSIKSVVQTLIQSDVYTIPTFSIVAHPIEARLQEDFFFSMKKFLHAIYTTSLVNTNTTRFFEHWWSRNLLRNLPFLLTSAPVTQMTDSWKKKPVIVVGAGPSLNKNIHLLKQAKGKALIFCVDTAYRILQRHGIVPDLLVTLDGSPMNAAHMQGCNYDNIPLLFDAYSHHEILENHKGPRIALSTVDFHSHWWKRVIGCETAEFALSQGGSVATAAFSFARLIGADPIILTGVDLSYPNGQCYANGALHDARNVKDMDRQLYPVKDIYGQDTYTTFDYMYYLKWFQEQAEANTDRTYINATEGGALTGKFLIQNLSDVLEKYCASELPIEEWTKAIKNKSIETEYLAIVRRNLVRSRTELRAIARYLKIMLLGLEQYVQKLQDRDFIDLGEPLKVVEKGNKKLSELPLALSFMDSHSFDAVYKDIRLSESIQRDRDDYTKIERTLMSARQSINLYMELYKIATESIQMHNEGIEAFDNVFGQQLGGTVH